MTAEIVIEAENGYFTAEIADFSIEEEITAPLTVHQILEVEVDGPLFHVKEKEND